MPHAWGDSAAASVFNISDWCSDWRRFNTGNLLSEIKLGQQQFKIMEMEALLTSYESTTKDWLESFDLGLEMLVSALDAHKREAATDTMEPALWEEIRANEIFVLTPPGY